MSQIRIIGGTFRGKKINVLDIADLRPTSNRVRETVFNWLMQDIKNAHCLDLFAGTGALGLEAFSRGANQVVLTEKNKEIFNHLKKESKTFKNQGNLTIINISAENFLKNNSQSFDIIFLDPPFQSDYSIYIQLIENSSALKPAGLLYIESKEEINLNTAKWKNLKLKKAGAVYFGLYKKI